MNSRFFHSIALSLAVFTTAILMSSCNNGEKQDHGHKHGPDTHTHDDHNHDHEGKEEHHQEGFTVGDSAIDKHEHTHEDGHTHSH